MRRVKWLPLPVLVGFLLTVAVATLASQATPADIPQSVNSGQHFLPPYANARDRFGFGSGSLTGYDVAQLNAGWYSDWGAGLDPAHPDQLVYVQLIRFEAGADPRDPAQVTVQPSKATIAQIAAAHPGSLWLISNEPDSLYQGNPILPEVYAVLYHDFRQYITGLDPSALIANGGIVQPTPCRLEYLDIVFDTYESLYGEAMPVDIWNIHAFILREVYGSWGASTPPGVDPACGLDYAVSDADDLDILLDNIEAMRTWMKDHGYQDRPLVITEYGILWPQWFAPQYTPASVSHFMTQTYALFLGATDLNIGYPADDYRLVQAWAWYSLSDDQHYNGYLFNSGSKTLSLMGETFGAYTAAISDALFADPSLLLAGASPHFSATITDASGGLSFTLSLTGFAANLGKLPANDAQVRSEILSENGGATLYRRDEFYTLPPRFDGVVVLPALTATLTVSGQHALRLQIDPEDGIVDPRSWNNVATTTLDLRPDLAVLGLAHQLAATASPSGMLTLTAAVGNQGAWPSPAFIATVHLETWPEAALVVTQALPIASMPIGDKDDLTTGLAWPGAHHDLYLLRLDLDEEDRVPEVDQDNNKDEQLVPMTVSANLVPTASAVLSSASGAIQLAFPTGVVSVPTEIQYTPAWPADWNTGTINATDVAFSLTAIQAGQVVSLDFLGPISFTWHYADAQVGGLDEAHMRIFALSNGGDWHDAACEPYQRKIDQNRLVGALCGTGQFIFGTRFDRYLPLISRQGLSPGSVTEPQPPGSGSHGSRTPLLLP